MVANESAIKAATEDFTRVDLVASYVDSDDYKTCKENGGVLVAFLRYIGLNDIAKGARAPRNTSAPAMPSHDTSDDDASDDLQKAAALLGGRIAPCSCCGKPTLEIDGLTACSDNPEAQDLYDKLKEMNKKEETEDGRS